MSDIDCPVGENPCLAALTQPGRSAVGGVLAAADRATAAVLAVEEIRELVTDDRAQVWMFELRAILERHGLAGDGGQVGR